MRRIGIIDSGVCNLTSVLNAFAFLDVPTEVVHTPDRLSAVSHILLPGVGSFPAGIRALQRGGFVEPLLRRAAAGVPICGICLGMQLLGKESTEFEPTLGLGLIPGRVVRMAPGDHDLRLPHIGWNEVTLTPTSRFAPALGERGTFYFVHGYAYADPDAPYVSGVCDYGQDVVAIVEHDNIVGFQFHPEKSQKAGLALLEAFATSC
jgi:glutamine amidotransferase